MKLLQKDGKLNKIKISPIIFKQANLSDLCVAIIRSSYRTNPKINFNIQLLV